VLALNVDFARAYRCKVANAAARQFVRPKGRLIVGTGLVVLRFAFLVVGGAWCPLLPAVASSPTLPLVTDPRAGGTIGRFAAFAIALALRLRLVGRTGAKT
jgi:hypothetical protein